MTNRQTLASESYELEVDVSDKRHKGTYTVVGGVVTVRYWGDGRSKYHARLTPTAVVISHAGGGKLLPVQDLSQENGGPLRS